VSIIGDHPIGIGEFGKFGDLTGTVEDIGMRSTRIRTLNRTVVSVPNSRSPVTTWRITRRGIRSCSIRRFRSSVLRLRSKCFIWWSHCGKCWRRTNWWNGTYARSCNRLAAAALSVEIFCYVRTADIDKFYALQGDLLLAINRALQEANVELA